MFDVDFCTNLNLMWCSSAPSAKCSWSGLERFVGVFEFRRHLCFLWKKISDPHRPVLGQGFPAREGMSGMFWRDLGRERFKVHVACC